MLTPEQIIAEFEKAGVTFQWVQPLYRNEPKQTTEGSMDASKLIEAGRAIERAAREEAIRECAKACQSIANNTDWVDRFRDGAAECADVLSALLEGS